MVSTSSIGETNHHDNLIEKHMSESFPGERKVGVGELSDLRTVMNTIDVLTDARRGDVPIIIL